MLDVLCYKLSTKYHLLYVHASMCMFNILCVMVTHWNNLTRERTKINCDAYMRKFDLAIAMISKDWRGNLVFACSIKVNTNIPIQVEAKALKWTVSTAMNHKLINISFESDCQVCIQSLTSSTDSIP